MFEARDYIRGMRAFHSLTLFGLAALAVALGGCKRSDASTTPSADVTADQHGFTPSSLEVPAGGPGSHKTVTFVRTTDKTCATEVVFPELDIKKPLPLNQAVPIDVPSDAPRSLTFQCGMGMYKGALLVK